jgi:hypothetical protein
MWHGTGTRAHTVTVTRTVALGDQPGSAWLGPAQDDNAVTQAEGRAARERHPRACRGSPNWTVVSTGGAERPGHTERGL